MNIHYYLIINEQASSGNGRKVARKVIQQLKKQELKYTALYTDYAGHEKELTKELAETTLLPWSEDLDVSTFPILVVLGGDGTLHNVINSLLPYDSAIFHAALEMILHEGWDYQEILIKHCIKSCAPDDQKKFKRFIM